MTPHVFYEKIVYPDDVFLFYFRDEGIVLEHTFLDLKSCRKIMFLLCNQL